jgi:hypothetical protein
MARYKETKAKGSSKKILIPILIIVIIIAGILLTMKILKDKNNNNETISLGTDEGIKAEGKKNEEIKIFSGKDRPIAVMIDNHKDAWPQAGLNDAYAIYEIIVEGGETRMMALFKGVNVEKIGPVRSSRHYFLDYALENDAIYAHYGWSPKAESDISTLKVNNINGITESSSDFWRIKQKSSPHNVLTSIENLKKIAEKKNYRTTSNSESVLKYTSKEVELDSEQVANKVTIPYSTLHTTSYEYNPETKRYTRYARNIKQTDFTTSEEITTKNIIITFAKNFDLKDSENKGRQDLTDVGTLDGYYITNGKAIKIKCEKSSRTEKTVYKDLNGNVINVNDGNTFFNICPIDAKVTFE